MEVIPDAQTISASTNVSPSKGTIQEAAAFEAEHTTGVSSLSSVHLGLSMPSDARMQPLAGQQSGAAGLISGSAHRSDSNPAGKTYSRDLAGLETGELRSAHFKVMSTSTSRTNVQPLLSFCSVLCTSPCLSLVLMLLLMHQQFHQWALRIVQSSFRPICL